MRIFLILLLLWAFSMMAATAVPVMVKITVDEVERTALVYPGKEAAKTPAPLVVAFHGFTGTARSMARMSRLHEAWPEATVVYPQGLILDHPRWGKKGFGWQLKPGDLNDRDLRFVDALLTQVSATYQVDARRVYATGMSNGALFTYELLTARPQLFAAFAPVAGAAGFLKNATVPKPVLIIHGKDDKLVPLNWAEGSRDMIRRLNGCGEKTEEWAPGYQRYTPCKSGQPVIWHCHDGGHIWPGDATKQIVKFFKEHALPEKKAEEPKR